MRVALMGQKQSDCEGYPPTNLTGFWDASSFTAGARDRRPEGMNKNIILVANNALADVSKNEYDYLGVKCRLDLR
mgnify:CR=1 FL=1